ncbi:EamA family transporter [Sphingorhabdus sp.]|jgi:drug/metabolite transporter (DMT)-like permease|uniref:EamA family transporter n=1 Tax=Sphingorhabdus sp. TaxID=1902408 RepID=UPI0037C5EB3B
MIWLPATLLAALFQAWRTAVQQRVRAELSVNAAGLVRYLYGLPVGLFLLGLYLVWRNPEIPAIPLPFLAFCAAAGFAQVIGTNLLLMAFGYRNYVAGTAFAKTEAIQGALIAFVLLGETLSWLTTCGIAVSVAGVMIVAAGGQRLRLSDMIQPAALCGLGAGLGFTMTSIFVKSASLELATSDKLLAALLALVVVQAWQTFMQGSYVALREKEQLPRVIATWRTSGQVGLLAALGSACWFTGFATAPVALVRAVGQIEVILTLGFSRFYLNEGRKPGEVLGLLLVGVGVALALIGGL